MSNPLSDLLLETDLESVSLEEFKADYSAITDTDDVELMSVIEGFQVPTVVDEYEEVIIESENLLFEMGGTEFLKEEAAEHDASGFSLDDEGDSDSDTDDDAIEKSNDEESEDDPFGLNKDDSDEDEDEDELEPDEEKLNESAGSFFDFDDDISIL